MGSKHRRPKQDRLPAKGGKQHVWLKLFVLLLIVVGISWVIYITGLWTFFTSRQRMLAFIDSLGPFGFLGFIVIQASQVVVAPVPGEATGLIGGFLYGPVIGTVLSTIGLTLGSYIAFMLSRRYGQPFVDRFVPKVAMDKFDFLLHHKGAFLVFLLFLIPGTPKDYLCYILGLGHLTTMEFILIGGTGRLFGTILLSFGGTYLREERYELFFILAGLAIIVVIVAMLFKERLERLFRVVHILDYKKRKSKRKGERGAPLGPD
jgi:uncharacterized membrane protein YdjX (TVP38/TMEM64 family)